MVGGLHPCLLGLAVPVFGDTTPAHVAASAAASGLAATLASQPIDVVKTRMQTQVSLGAGAGSGAGAWAAAPYRGAMHCLWRVAATEGPRGLLRGFLPRYARLGPWQLIFFVTFEKMLWLTGGRSFSVA